MHVTAPFYPHMIHIYLMNYDILRRLTFCLDATKKASNMETLSHSGARNIFLRLRSGDEQADIWTVCVQRHQPIEGFPLRTVAFGKRRAGMSRTFCWCKQYFGGSGKRGEMSSFAFSN